MARRNFPVKIKRAAIRRAEFVCEGITPAGSRCITPIGKGNPVEYDHVLPDWMGGEPTLENCAALCKLCHKIKTALDATDRAQANRRFDRHNSIGTKRSRLVSRGFDPAEPQHSATRKLSKQLPPPLNLYAPRA